MKNISLILLLMIGSNVSAQQNWLASFEAELGQTDTFWNGSDRSGKIVSSKLSLSNDFNPDWQTWSGFAVSSMRDSTTKGYTNEYSAITASGVSYSNNYAVFGIGGKIWLDQPDTIRGCYVTNSTYAYLSMRDGDQFSKKFGGSNGTDPDYFKITATGYTASGTKTTEFLLADFTSSDPTKDYIIKDWMYFPLDVLGAVDSIVFSLSSSDTGQFGMNTPAYFCVDDINALHPDFKRNIKMVDLSNVLPMDTFDNGAEADGGFYLGGYYFTNEYNPQWKTWSGFALSSMNDTIKADYSNQYSSVAGIGQDESYLVCYGRGTVYLPHSPINYTFYKTAIPTVTFEFSNSTWAYYAMKDGNQFAKKFGGEDGTDPDFLQINILATFYDGSKSDTVNVKLADFRSKYPGNHYIHKKWVYDPIVLENLFNPYSNRPTPVKLDFWLEGSDTGQFGLNTPAYFCMKNVFKPDWFGRVPSTNSVDWRVYPVPAHDVIQIETDVPLQYQLMDINGRICQTGHTSGLIELNRTLSGVYFLQLSTDGRRTVKRIIIN